MIIGNNNFNSNDNNFKNKMNAIKENANNFTSNSNSINTNRYKDINNSNEMSDISLDMLQDRLNRGLISYEDFQKQCAKIGKLRK